jgi:asparagine synthetase B (glutamine-hydrolysing)
MAAIIATFGIEAIGMSEKRSRRVPITEKEAEMSEEVVYTSKIRVERVKGPLRRAYLPVEPEPIWFGVHSEIAARYGVSPEVSEPHATTLDYLVAATGG